MERKHNKKRNKNTVQFKINDLVTVLIPRIDRGGSDLPRLPGKIIKISGEFHQILTKHGILNDQYLASNLEPYHGLLDLMEDKIVVKKISLREAARLVSNRPCDLKEAEISCSCKTKCLTKHCPCRKQELECNSHCHGNVKNLIQKNICENS